MIRYTDIKYAANRLVGTIVLYDKQPVYIRDMVGQEVNIEYLDSGLKATVSYTDKFDLTPVPLGHTNFMGNAFYVARIPMRQDWRQGLRETTTRVLQVDTNPKVPLMINIPFPNLAKTILGQYPSLTQAVSDLNNNGGMESVAFSRAYALDKAKNIWFKGRLKIGCLLDPKKKEYTLEDKFFWARETLEEALNA